MDCNNTSSGLLHNSTLSSEEDDDVDEFFIAHIINEYKEIFLYKTSQKTSMLSSVQFIRDNKWSSLDMLWTISNG